MGRMLVSVCLRSKFDLSPFDPVSEDVKLMRDSNYVPKFISGEEGQRLEKLVWDSVVKHLDEVAPGVLAA